MAAQFGPSGTAAECRQGRERCNGICCKKGQICARRKCVTGAGNCPAGADVCAPETGYFENCNGRDNCFCYQTVAGKTRCGNNVTACGTCTSNADCKEFGRGAACAVAASPGCDCTAGQAFCITPCPA